MKAKRIIVTVKRSPMDIQSKIIYAHELPCLEVHHGAGNIQVLTTPPDGMNPNDVAAMKIVENINAKQEWARLENTYGRHPEHSVSVVSFAFQNSPQALVDFDLEKHLLVRDGLEDANEQSIDDPDEPGDDDQNDDADIALIKERLNALDVKYRSNAKLETLANALREELEHRLDVANIDYEDEATLEALYQKLPPTFANVG